MPHHFYFNLACIMIWRTKVNTKSLDTCSLVMNFGYRFNFIVLQPCVRLWIDED